MGGYFELVLFTDTTATYAEPIINKLDPHRWGHCVARELSVCGVLYVVKGVACFAR